MVSYTNTLSMMADESTSTGTPVVSLSEVTGDFQSHTGEPSSQSSHFVQFLIPSIHHRA